MKKNKKALKAKYSGMPIEEQALRAEIDEYLEKHPGKMGRDYQIPEVTKKQKKVRDILYYVKGMIPVVVIFVLLYVVFMLGFVPSSSMLNTLHRGDIIIANRLAYKIDEPKRGDIIIFKKNGAYLTKRVIGLPGETVILEGGKVFVNGRLLDEPYLADGTFTLPFIDGNNMSVFEVPKSAVLLFGDNRTDSADARAWLDKSGNPSPYVSYKSIAGKVFASISSKTGIKTYKGYSYEQEQIDVSEIETTDETAATVDPNTVFTEEAVMVNTLPVDIEMTEEIIEEETMPETSPVEEESVQETLPIANFD